MLYPVFNVTLDPPCIIHVAIERWLLKVCYEDINPRNCLSFPKYENVDPQKLITMHTIFPMLYDL